MLNRFIIAVCLFAELFDKSYEEILHDESHHLRRNIFPYKIPFASDRDESRRHLRDKPCQISPYLMIVWCIVLVIDTLIKPVVVGVILIDLKKRSA